MLGLRKWGRKSLKKVGRKVLKRLEGISAPATAHDEVDDPAPSPSRLPATAKREVLSFSYGDSRKAAQVFGARRCMWSGRAISLLESENLAPNYVDLDHPASGPMKEELQAETKQLTVPFIYLRGRFIGGFNALDEIARLGQLPYLTLNKEEQKSHPLHGKFEVASRACLSQE